MRTMIERLDFAGHTGAEVGRFIYAWKDLRQEGWEVSVVILANARGTPAALVGLAVKE